MKRTRKPTLADLKAREKQTQAAFAERMKAAKTDDERDALLAQFTAGTGPFAYQDYRKAKL